MMAAKPIEIEKSLVVRAWQQVKSNRGTAGIDQQSLADFEQDLKGNLYKVWNRLSSGSYFPPSVRQVGIPKKSGGTRYLGVPTVGDRVAQTVIKMLVEPHWDPVFHADSYGYRPGKSAHDAVGVTRRRCWDYDWVVEFDVRGAFDNIDHELLLKAVRKHTPEKWQVMYIERWLKASSVTPEGDIIERERGTPQGGVIGPLLLNLFMHYTFDAWMTREHADKPFARYADDAVAHCQSRSEAEALLDAISLRLASCKLQMHPEKSKVVYCKDSRRRERYPNVQFTFLGFTFRPRRARNRWGRDFTGFLPAVSDEAIKAMRARIRSWRIHRWSGASLEELAERINPILQGWWHYYSKFYSSALRPVFDYLNRKLMQWARRKFRRLRGKFGASFHWLRGIRDRAPSLFIGWQTFGLPSARW
jgi:RNA-directed DNA polymerase